MLINIRQESYEVGSEHNSAQPNIWLPEETLPGYREFSTKFYWELNKAAQTILEAISFGLSLPNDEKNDFLQLHSGHNNQLRYLHYPPVETEKIERKVIGRMPAHQDWSSFTMLFQDDVGGLELEHPHHRGTFLAAKPIPGACVVNIGDMLQRFTNGMSCKSLTRSSSFCQYYLNLSIHVTPALLGFAISCADTSQVFSPLQCTKSPYHLYSLTLKAKKVKVSH